MEKKDLSKERDTLLLGPNTLAVLGIQSQEQINVIEWWQPGGAETYIATFRLEEDTGLYRDLIAKACVKLCPKETTEEWLQRRRQLTENGVIFPEIYAVDRSTIIEEFIPYSFLEAYKSADETIRTILEDRFKDTYLRIKGAGFYPASLHDLRSHGADAVVIDVGEDIGAPTAIAYCDLSSVIDAEKNFRAMISRI